MTEKFVYIEHKGADYILDTPNWKLDFIEMLGDCLEAEEIVDLLNDLTEENEQLKAQLYCPFDSICIQCTNEYLVQKEEHYVSKCKKGHEQCSKVDVKYCDDFELKGDVE